MSPVPFSNIVGQLSLARRFGDGDNEEEDKERKEAAKKKATDTDPNWGNSVIPLHCLSTPLFLQLLITWFKMFLHEGQHYCSYNLPDQLFKSIEDVMKEVKMPLDPRLIKTASRKHGFETLGLKAVLWRILLRSAKIFRASSRLRNCWTLSFRPVGGWNIAWNI